jgi:hypothetical protein
MVVLYWLVTFPARKILPVGVASMRSAGRRATKVVCRKRMVRLDTWLVEIADMITCMYFVREENN